MDEVSNPVSTVMCVEETLLPETDLSTQPCINHMGEKFTSMRPFLKRFYPYAYRIKTPDNNSLTSDFYPYLPLEPFISNVATVNRYPLVMMTPARYISNMFFGVRGSIRYRGVFAVEPDHDAAIDITRSASKVSIHRDFKTPFLETVSSTVNWMWNKLQSGTGETCYAVKQGEPVFVEVPYQNVSQYYPTHNIDPTYTQVTYGVSFDFMNAVVPNYELYNSIGEDFNPVIWNGVPLVSIFSPS